MGCPPRVWVGEDTEGVGASADFAVKALARGVVANLGPYPGREGREREDVCPGLIEVITHGGELVVDVVHAPVGLARQVARGRTTGGWREACGGGSGCGAGGRRQGLVLLAARLEGGARPAG